MRFMRVVAFMVMFFTSFFLNGCIDLAVNDGKKKHIDIKKTNDALGEVYTMRGGLGGIFSKGMNRLEDTLANDYRVYASSTVWYKAPVLSHAIIKQYREKSVHGPIVLVGHSLGANEQINVASQLARAHIPVALLITVDPVLPLTVPSNVAYVLNIYQPSFVPLFSGLPLRALDPKRTHVENVNVAKWSGVAVNHFTIDGDLHIQQLMLDRVLIALHKKPSS